jgi:hypothetical protein
VSVATQAKAAMSRALVAYWKRHDTPVVPTREFSMNPSDNIQIAMNLVMPLADPSPVGRALLIQTLAGAVQEVIAGLNNTAIVHFARFTIVDGNLCMFSMYDGDFSNYIRDFIYNIGEAFDALLAFIKDPPPLPVEKSPDEFIEWVRQHDSLQLPERITDLSDDVLKLPRRLTLILDDHENTQLFSYRAYPGYTAAQIRNSLELGW